MSLSEDEVKAGQTSRGVPYLSGGASWGKRIVVLAGIDALFRPLDGGPRAIRRAAAIARLLPPRAWTIVGYGAPGEGMNLDQVADDTAAAIQETGGRPDALVGISFGGLVAQRLAVGHPDLVPRLVLLVSAHRFSDAGRARMARQMEQLAAGDLAGLVRDNALLFRRPWLNGLARAALWLRGKHVTDGFREPADLLAGYRSLFPDDLRLNGELARRIAAPTLVIGGSDDQLFGAEVFRETAEMIAGARLALFQRETHMLPLERARAVAAEIRGFCRER
jgi:pimeloyl-ACP methyl ester carboxylesterase